MVAVLIAIGVRIYGSPEHVCFVRQLLQPELLHRQEDECIEFNT